MVSLFVIPLSYGQVSYVGEYTTTEKNTLTIPSGRRAMLWDSTLGFLQLGNSTPTWESFLFRSSLDTFAELDALVADQDLAKHGDNISEFTNDAGYITSSSGDGLGTDRDVGPFTVSNSGNTATMDTGSITSSHIFDGTITGTDIATGTITGADIQDASIGSADYASNSIGTDKLDALAVTEAKIAANAVTSAKISDGTILSADISNGTIVSADINDGAISTAKVTDDAITEGKLDINSGVSAADKLVALDGTGGFKLVDEQTASDVSITDTAGDYTATDVEAALAELANGTVIEHTGGDVTGFTALNIVGDAITSEKILDGEVETSDIAADAVTEGKLDMHNSPTNGQVLGYDSTNGMQWQNSSSGIVLHPFSDVQIDSIYVGTEAQIAARPLGTDVLAFATDSKVEYRMEVPLGAVGHDVATGTDLTFVSIDEAITITSVYASVKTAGTTSVITYDINLDDGTPASILSTKLTIDATERFSSTAATAAVISDTTIPADSFLTFDCDTADSGDTGADGTIVIKYTVD